MASHILNFKIFLFSDVLADHATALTMPFIVGLVVLLDLPAIVEVVDGALAKFASNNEVPAWRLV